MTEQPVQRDRKDLKIQALMERISEIVAEYENKDAERRIQLTEAADLVNALRERVTSLEESVSSEPQEEA